MWPTCSRRLQCRLPGTLSACCFLYDLRSRVLPRSMAPLVDAEEHEACCSDAVSVLAVLRSLEARLTQALHAAGTAVPMMPAVQANPASEAVPALLPVLPEDLPLQVMMGEGLEVKAEPMQAPEGMAAQQLVMEQVAHIPVAPADDMLFS